MLNLSKFKLLLVCILPLVYGTKSHSTDIPSNPIEWSCVIPEDKDTPCHKVLEGTYNTYNDMIYYEINIKTIRDDKLYREVVKNFFVRQGWNSESFKCMGGTIVKNGEGKEISNDVLSISHDNGKACKQLEIKMFTKMDRAIDGAKNARNRDRNVKQPFYFIPKLESSEKYMER
ncbi:MAG: hypothetical protein JJV93_01020 [Alphaproteobacteria bacterium]|nr:hypothetical protein [Alphaproteobacteria bacterium]MBL0717833.1 hypothetical protein [Alphaproteobacteria bacterium]